MPRNAACFTIKGVRFERLTITAYSQASRSARPSRRAGCTSATDRSRWRLWQTAGNPRGVSRNHKYPQRPPTPVKQDQSRMSTFASKINNTSLVREISDNANSTSILSSQGGLTTTFQSKISLPKTLPHAEFGLHYPWRLRSRHVQVAGAR
jgi:hypothetical protein